MKYITLILLIICFSCSSADESPAVKPNSKPGSIKIESILLDGPLVTIDWSDAQDEDGDQIFYKLYINSILISETTESIASTTLTYNTDYTGRIIGTDKKGGTTEVNFEFSSSKSKILLYSDSSGSFNALDLYTLKPMWTTTTSFIESHTVSGNLIYSGLNGINGLDILSGEIKWTSTPSIYHNLEYRNIIVDDSNVYAFDSGSILYCVNKITGGKLWERGFFDYYAPLSMDSDKVFVCSTNNDHLYAINKLTGVVAWSFKLDSNAYRINTNPLIINNDIYFGDNLGEFYSLNKNTGLKNWSVNEGQYNSFSLASTQFNDLIIAGTSNTLYAYNSNTGAVIWEYTPTTNGEGFKTSPFIYNNNIYIGTSNTQSAKLLCLNANNGSVIWSLDLENETTSSPIVFEDTVYIGDWNKNMYAVNAETGTIDWKIKTDGAVIKSPTIVIGMGETVIYPSVSGLKN